VRNVQCDHALLQYVSEPLPSFLRCCIEFRCWHFGCSRSISCRFIRLKQTLALASVETEFGRKRVRDKRARPLKPQVGDGQISGAYPAPDRRASFTRKNSGLKKTKRPTSVVESYKTTYGHKVVALVSVVEEEQKTGGHWWPARRSPMRRRAGRGTLCPPRLSAPRGRAA
jgi:hypothetical protein